MTPRGDQKRPKITPTKMASRRSCCDVFLASICASIFCRFGVRCWLPLGALLGTKIGHCCHRFVDDLLMSFQDRPKSGQEPPRASQEPPKSAQERPKRSPRAAKSGPRAPKSCPRGAQERPRAAQERSEGHLGAILACFGTFLGGKNSVFP